MNPFRIKLLDERRDSVGDMTNSKVDWSWSPADILARISDGSLRLPTVPSPGNASDLPRWSDYVGVLKDPGPDEHVLQQALDGAAREMQTQADANNDAWNTMTPEASGNYFADLGLLSQAIPLYGSTVQWNAGPNKKFGEFGEISQEGKESAKVESTVTLSGLKTREA